MDLSRIRRLPAALAVAAALALAPVGATQAAEDGLTATQKQQVEQVIQDYLLENPEILMRALDNLRVKQKAAEEQRLQSVLTSRAEEIFRDGNDPQTGAADGDVVVVEFFDYQCPYCKRVMKPVLETVKADGKVRLVFKEFPILGATSVFAAKAALASTRQGKYMEFHRRLMGAPGRLNRDIVLSIARSVGLDTDRLRKDMESPEVLSQIQRNYDLADELKIDATPAFLIGKRLIPGAIGPDDLKRLIADARAGS